MRKNEIDIAEFWQKHPCGDTLVQELKGDYKEFFDRYDAYRYSTESHILSCLDGINFSGKKVLEIGLGQGADSEQIIRRGGNWTGLDLTKEAIQRTRIRLDLKGLPYNEIRCASVLDTGFPDGTFDIIFSHGVLHHVPNIMEAQKELRRIIKPKGELIIMVYAKYSLNYWLSISVIRRLGVILFYCVQCTNNSIVLRHLENARKQGLTTYLKMENFIHCNTDGPDNPYSKVYTLKEAKKDFKDFIIYKSYKRFMHAPPLPVRSLPLASALGWHLWAHMVPK